MLGSDTIAAGGDTIGATGREVLDAAVREDTDAALVASAKAGDVGAFGRLVERHQRAVYAVVSRMISSRDDVDDIVQEAFLSAYRSIGAFKGEAAFSTWIYRIAVNTSIKHTRKMKTRAAASLDDPCTGLSESLVAATTEGPEDAAQRKAREEAVREAVHCLPEKHRAVVVLYYFQELGCEEIAKVLDCSVGTVWSRLHYACKKLQAHLACEL